MFSTKAFKIGIGTFILASSASVAIIAQGQGGFGGGGLGGGGGTTPAAAEALAKQAAAKAKIIWQRPDDTPEPAWLSSRNESI